MKTKIPVHKTYKYKLTHGATGKIRETRQLTEYEASVFNYAYALNVTGLKLVK